MRLIALIAVVALPALACEMGDDTSPPGDTTAPPADTGAPPADTAPAVDTVEIPDEPRDFVNGAVARVGHIIDGDTLDVLVGETFPNTYTVRLAGINAPECLKRQVNVGNNDWRYACSVDDEFYGLAAYEGVVAIADGQRVRVTCDGVATGAWCPTDNFGRYLAYLELPNGDDLATRIAWHGYGWSFTSFASSKRAEICAAEYDARDNDRGMWSAGTVAQVIARMSAATQNWYNRYHDKDCDKALGR